MRRLILPFISLVFLAVISMKPCAAQESSPGPVFNSLGAVYELPDVDVVPDSTQVLKAIFDIDYKQEDPAKVNPLINSLARYINMHVRVGIPLENIHLAFVLHGASGKDALSNEAYKKRFGVDNPNTALIKALAEKGAHMYICGQSATYRGYEKSELMSEVKMALSAMTVLTVYQARDYALIRF